MFDGRRPLSAVGSFYFHIFVISEFYSFLFSELGLHDGQEVYIADPTTPNTITFKLTLGCNME